MHEAPIAQALLDAAVAAIPTPGVVITRLTVAIGPFAGVDPECLRFYFSELCRNTPAAGAELILTPCPAKQLCDSCGYIQDCSSAFDVTFVCSKCGSGTRLEGGSDLYLDSIEVT